MTQPTVLLRATLTRMISLIISLRLMISLRGLRLLGSNHIPYVNYVNHC